ncbi:B- and T-lymphocyte attenuator [Salmo salar]|uniref:B- and T-lymphocyte attenuator n=1 Tax=Salmo salar TaxID=8030 RepID=A0A1S3PPC4_SALSA|nr:B- and T-lymphocyte attenuator [Salmo salar]|eukprot:XP_014029481.1 PREDICTED: B- and T-lymphocyte attenuator [Salmo salar]
MDRLRSDHILLVLCLLFLLCVHGNAQGQGPTCEMRVKRNTIWNAVPQKALKIDCPVRHCGENLHATWCKFVDLLNCKQIHETEQVTFRWREKNIWILDFKKISMNDNGLYRCGVAENGSTTVSHAIKVSVSDSNLEITSTADHNTNDSPNTKPDRNDPSFLPYVYICVGTVVLVVIVTAFSLFCLNAYKGPTRSTENRTKKQEMSTLAATCPDISFNLEGTFPSSPSTPNPVQPANLYDNGLYCNRINDTNEALPSSNIRAGGQVSNHLVYASLNHETTRGSLRSPHIPTPQHSFSEYAVIRVY